MTSTPRRRPTSWWCRGGTSPASPTWDRGDDALIGRLVRKARDLARKHGLAERGFRLVFNAGDDAGYSVHHIHLHLVGGRKLAWPPG